MKVKEKNIKLEKITSISNFNPRKSMDASKIEELAKSIEENGLIHKVVVVLKQNKEYELISGQRRKLAFDKLGRKTIPAKILKKPTDNEKLSIIIVENIQREDVVPIEMANAIEQLYKMLSGNISEVAEKIGKSESTVRKYRHMLKLSDKIKEDLASKQLKLPVKTSSEIGRNFPKEKQQIVVDVVESRPQDTQLKIIKELKNDFKKIHIYAKPELINRFMKKVLNYRLENEKHISYDLIEELKRINDGLNNIVNKSPILHIFNNFEKITELDRFIHEVKSGFNLHHLEDNIKLKHHPMDILKYLLEDIRLNIKNYDQDFKEEVSNDLLNFIDANIVSEQILRMLSFLNQESNHFTEEIIPELLKKITDNQLESDSALALFNFYEYLYFKNHLNIIKDVLNTENGDIRLKRLIIDCLNKRDENSFEIRELQQNLLKLYENTEDKYLKSNLEKLMVKIGKI